MIARTLKTSAFFLNSGESFFYLWSRIFLHSLQVNVNVNVYVRTYKLLSISTNNMYMWYLLENAFNRLFHSLIYLEDNMGNQSST